MSFAFPSSETGTTQQIVACSGIAWWKRRRIQAFFVSRCSIRFFHSPQRALFHAKRKKGGMAVWANRMTPALQIQARLMDVPLYTMEDGFIRSMGLGSDFLPPCSIIMDSQGAYVDPSHPSDLEELLQNTDISTSLRQRADSLITRLRKLHISKYAATTSASSDLDLPDNRRVILVPGQVASDLSVIRGGGEISDNLSLLKEVRRHNPEAWIIYRPHPDVEAGHRPGHLPDALVMSYANMIHRDGNMSQLLEKIDEVHTLTSLTGFEALLRRKAVTTYGAPFYAGWGLTTHRGPHLPRRGRKLDITELAAVVLILYPLYINPETEQRCEVEELIDCFGKASLWRPTFAMRLRQKQGQLRRYFARVISSYRTPHA